MISMVALWYASVLCLNIAQEKAFEFIYFSATLSFVVALIPLVCMIFVVVSWLFKRSKAIARGLKMLRAKICGRCNSEYEMLDSGDHATTPHRMDYPEDYREKHVLFYFVQFSFTIFQPILVFLSALIQICS